MIDPDYLEFTVNGDCLTDIWRKSFYVCAACMGTGKATVAAALSGERAFQSVSAVVTGDAEGDLILLCLEAARQLPISHWSTAQGGVGSGMLNPTDCGVYSQPRHNPQTLAQIFAQEASGSGISPSSIAGLGSLIPDPLPPPPLPIDPNDF